MKFEILNFKKYLKYIIYLICIISILFIYFVFNKKTSSKVYSIDDTIKLKDEDNKEKVEDEKIIVDIKGAIKNPGIYELEDGMRINDVILKSGGLTKNADTRYINLSKKLEDEMIIIVYTKDEIEKAKEDKTIIKYVEAACVCPEVNNDACIEETVNNKISLNLATQEELESLPGIGSSKAVDIIEYREKNNGFKSIEELMEISGIGNSVFEKIKELVTI